MEEPRPTRADEAGQAVRERNTARRDLTIEAAQDNGAASPDTIAARWRAPPTLQWWDPRRKDGSCVDGSSA
jgi:hypothetical protein